MSKILITGNGFDLFHHLPTKYHHFISIMETIEKFQFKNEVSFTDLFGRFFKDRFSNDFESIIDNYNVEQIKFDNSKIKQVDELLKSNLWYKHFKNVCEIETWIDFEMEIESILKQLIYFSNIRNKIDIKRNGFTDKLNIPNEFESFEIISIIQKDFSFKLNEKYINQRNNSINIKKILEDLVQSFEDFIVIFNRYLVDIVSVFYAEVRQNSIIPLHLMDEIYTFNYTPTLEKFYNIEKSKVVYLHGKINENNNIQNLVLGVSEISNNIEENKIYNFKKNYQKIKKVTNNKFIHLPINESIVESQFFYLIGHSLDKSDKNYILDLFEYLKIDNTKLSEIIIFYYDQKDYINKLNNLFSVVNEQVLVELNKENRFRFVDFNLENILLEFEKPIFNRYAEM